MVKINEQKKQITTMIEQIDNEKFLNLIYKTVHHYYIKRKGI